MGGMIIPVSPFCHKEEGESLPEVINRGNAVSANKPRARGLQKKRFSLPEITTIPSDSYEKVCIPKLAPRL